jgi:predicted ester cyclase
VGVEENKEVVRRWIEEAMPALMRDPSRIDDLLGEYHHESRTTRTPHHHDHTDTGLDGFRNELRNAAASFRDVDSIAVDVILAEGDLVAAHWTLKESPTTGEGVLRHVGKVDTGGQSLGLSGLIIYRVTDGKIGEAWHYTNIIDVLLRNRVLTLEPVGGGAGG